jgi:L-asparaginase II
MLRSALKEFSAIARITGGDTNASGARNRNMPLALAFSSCDFDERGGTNAPHSAGLSLRDFGSGGVDGLR